MAERSGSEPDELEDLEPVAYRAYLATDEPVGLHRPGWVIAAIAAGAAVGRLAASPEEQLGALLVGALILGFMVLAVVSPYRAAQLYLVVVWSGLADSLTLALPQTNVGAGLPFVALLGFGWLVGPSRPTVPVRHVVAALFVLLMMFIAFELVGSARDNLWVVAQNDFLPALALASFIPLVSAMRTEREVRGIVVAAGIGLGLLAVRTLAQYVTHFDAPFLETTTPWFRILGEQGLGGGPRILPSYHRGSMFVIAFVGAVIALRPRRGAGLAVPWSMLIGTVFLLALLVTYSRSLILTGAGAVVVAIVLLRGQPMRAARVALWLGGLLFVLLIVIPLLTGRRPGVVFEALRERFTDITADASYTDRLAEDREGLEAFGERPLIGSGLGADVFVPEFPNRLPGYFHNAYVGLLVKTGIVGTAVFLGVYLGLLVWAVRVARGSEGFPAAILSAGAAGLIGLMVASFSEPFILFPPAYQYVALLAAVTAFYAGRLRQAAEAEEEAAVEARALSPSRSG